MSLFVKLEGYIQQFLEETDAILGGIENEEERIDIAQEIETLADGIAWKVGERIDVLIKALYGTEENTCDQPDRLIAGPEGHEGTDVYDPHAAF
jgi:hypothetical protein